MDSVLGLTIGLVFLALAFGIRAFREKKQMEKLKKRLRYLSERLEAVEKFNGLNQTNTDFTLRKSLR